MDTANSASGVPAILSLAVWLPLVFLAGGSLMGSLELKSYLGPVLAQQKGHASWSFLPLYPTLQPYVELLLDSPAFFVMFWNSVFLAVGTVIGQLLVATTGAWWFARRRGKIRDILFTTYIVLMLMPFQVTMVSNYLVLDNLKILDTLWGILLPLIFSTFPVFLIYRFFRSIPPAIIEAAAIDGAGEWRIFFQIGIPMGKSGVVSALVLAFLEAWNLVEQPMVFLKTKSNWPLSLFLPAITTEKAGLALAASVVMLLPALLVFIYGQNDLEQGMVASSIKE